MSRYRCVPFGTDGDFLGMMVSAPEATRRSAGRADTPGAPSATDRTSVPWR